MTFDGLPDALPDGLEATFLPADPPRAARLALWHHRSPGVSQPAEKITLLVPGPTGVHRRQVPAHLLPLSKAVPFLLNLPTPPTRPPDGPPAAATGAAPARSDGDGDTVTPSLRAWGLAVLGGLRVVAKGRLLPTASPAGHGSWRAGPLDPDDAEWLRRLAAALPAEAYASPVHARRPLLATPESVLIACWDALADHLARPTAPTGLPSDLPAALAPLAAPEPLPAGPLRPFLDEVARESSSSVRLILRMTLHAPTPHLHPDGAEPGRAAGLRSDGDRAELASGGELRPDGDRAGLATAGEAVADGDQAVFGAELGMRSVTDPSLEVGLGELWRRPAEVGSRFGVRAEEDLLVALRRAARAFPPLTPALGEASPERVALPDEAVAGLLESAGALTATGAEVLWPAELVRGGPRLAATTSRPPADGGTALRLDELLEFDWHATVDGEPLRPDEVAALADAKRPLVRMRGRWVRVDRDLVARLRRSSRRLTAAQALAAALTGTLRVGDETLDFHAEPVLADLAARLTALGAAAEPVPAPAGLHATLRPYQQRGLAWLAAMCRLGLGGCLADDMGLGKTIQIIALHLLLHADDPGERPASDGRRAGRGPTLVVCPTSLLGNWEREVQRFAPDVPVRRYHGAERELSELPAGGIVLATYGVLRRDRARLAEVGWGLVAADEAQHVKNPLSGTARALRGVPAAARLALTGTPVENRLTDLWALLDWTTPGLLGTLPDFRHRVSIPVERYGDADATRRFGRLVRPFLLRRRKTDPGIAPELPPKTETDRLVPLTAEQVTLYQAVVAETMAEIEAANGIGRRGLVLKLLTALKQICNHPAQYLGQAGPLAGRSGKLAALDELLEVILAERESVLVFSQYVGMGRLLEEHLAARGVPTLFVHGGVGGRQREARVAAFQDGAAPVFLLSLKAAGTGLNLTRASHVVHYDRWWNPAVEDQATDRAYRIGQDRPVQVHRLVTEHTVEDRVARLIADKRRLADAVVGTGEQWLTELSDTDLAALVSLSQP